MSSKLYSIEQIEKAFSRDAIWFFKKKLLVKQLADIMRENEKLREALFKIEGLADGDIERIALDALCSSKHSVIQDVLSKMFTALQEAKEIISSDLGTEIASIEEALEEYNKLHIHQKKEE